MFDRYEKLASHVIEYHSLNALICRLSPAEAEAEGHETSLKLEMGPVSYVHTRRFVGELQAFARDFSLLRRVIAQARAKVFINEFIFHDIFN